MSPKKSGGLVANPLLVKTDPQVEEELPVSREKTTPVHQPTSTPVDTPTDTPAGQQTVPVKGTFYFTEDQLDRLEEAWKEVRQITRKQKQQGSQSQRISKSRFVRLALERLLADFKADQERVLEDLRKTPEP